ncbi:MAG: TatD family hydrolase [Patescibacteria group bacterium]
MSKYIDIHSHLNLSPLSEDQDAVIVRMVEAGVGTITIGVDYETSQKAVEIASKYDFIWAGVGLHPTDNMEEEFDIEKYKTLAENPKVVCIGECGLDYFRDQREEIKIKQKEIFKKHIELALEIGKPLMIHARPSKGSMDAYEDALNILEQYKKENDTLAGNFHFFVGDINIAQRALAINFTMSFDGPITFARDYDEVINFLPLTSIMAETDSPFASPVPYRGKTNEPAYVIEIVKKIAEIKNLSEEDVAQALLQNVKRVFNI